MIKKISQILLISCFLFILAACKHEHAYEDKIVAPTCTEQGYTEHTCECGDTFKDTYTEVLEHTYGEWVITKEATEDEEGLQEKECSVCGNKIEEKIEKLAHEHKYENVITNPTCTEQGYTSCVCKCGDSYIDSYEDALGHTYGEWVVVKEPTTTETGLQEKECVNCHDKISEEIEMLVSKYTTLEGKTISFLGDSITTFYAEGSAVNSYYSGTNQFYYPIYSSTVKTVEQTWWYQLYNNTAMKLGINNSWSGSCAYGTGASAGVHDDRINTLDDNGIPDVVIVYLGTNDCAGGFALEDFSDAIKTIIEKINALGKTQIYLTTLGYSAYEFNSTTTKYRDANRILYNEELRKIATEYECGIIPLDEYVVEDNYSIYLGDNLHYNAKGATLLSLVAEKAIKEYNDIPFDKEIEVEHKEVLPAGTLATLTATANDDFWNKAASNIFLYEASAAPNPLYSLRIQLTAKDGKYYVTTITKSNETVTYDSDYVIIVSDSHTSKASILDDLAKVVVGSIAEFDATAAFPINITFKTGDGNGPESNPGGSQEEVKDMLNSDGSLHISLYNEKIWQEYEKKAAIYTGEQMNSSESGNTFMNFNIIKIDLISDNEYKVVELKNSGTGVTFTDNDYYIIIFAGTTGETFYKTLSVNDTIVITGDITTGNCDVKLK